MSGNSFQDLCRNFAHQVQANPPQRTPSLVATLFGDVVEAYGGEIWLGSLSRLLAPFGINERLVRTSVHRLSKEGVLTSIRQGRRSFYSLTPSARKRVSHFDRRIYYSSTSHWDGKWRLVFTGTRGVKTRHRTEVRKQLIWQGFGVIAPNVYGHPTAPLEPVYELLERLGISDQVVVMLALNHGEFQGLGPREMARQCFNVDQLESKYRDFVVRYLPLLKSLDRQATPFTEVPEHCFVVRIMLIHEYRRILLQDPDLPPQLLPSTWVGREAKQLCATLYRHIEAPAAQHISALGENRNGLFTGLAAEHANRFPS